MNTIMNVLMEDHESVCMKLPWPMQKCKTHALNLAVCELPKLNWQANW